VREERVGLEDRVDGATVRRAVAHLLAVDVHAARGRELEAGDHPQRRRLPAAGGTEEREELAVLDVEVERVDRHDLIVEARLREALRHLTQ